MNSFEKPQSGLDPDRSQSIYWLHMSETYDRRRRTDLDLFVLALIESGISTPYQLQKAASFSQGATIPALQRLLGAGLVAQGKPGLRRRTEYKITAHGKRTLGAGWRVLIEDGPTSDLDADLRIALLALWVGRNPLLAREFLQRSAERRMETIGLEEERIELDKSFPLAYWYRRLRSSSADSLVKAESEAARVMARLLPTKLHATPVRAKRRTNPHK